MKRYVVVSGIPGSGKTTLARAVAAPLSLPVVDKDTFLEALLSAHSVTSAPERAALSRAADVSFRSEAGASPGALLVSWWQHPRSAQPSGTPTAWLSGLSGLVVELYCRCSPATAADRFLARERHPGHLDGRWSRSALVASLSEHAALGPLGLGRVVEASTDSPTEPLSVAQGIRAAFDSQVR